MDFSEELVMDYQNRANKTLASACRVVAALMFLIGMLNYVGVFVIESKLMYVVVTASLIVALLPTLIFNILKRQTITAQYFVLTALVFMSGMMYTVLSYHAVIMMVFPIICACLYSDKKLDVYTIIISVPVILMAHLAAYWFTIVPDEPLVTLRGVLLYGFLPRIIQFLAIGVICINVTKKMHKLIQSLVNKNNELFDNQQMLIQSLAELVEAQSQETGEYVKRVSEYTKILCIGMGYSPEETWMVSIASMMHDVGKILVPSEIIEKPGKLTTEEFEQVKLHVDYGKKMLEKSPGKMIQLSSTIAYEHHERWDGTGYKHLKGEEIDKYARCVAVADVFDALVSARPYKAAWTADEAYEEIIAESGKHFDPDIVKVFKENFEQFKAVLKQYPDTSIYA